MAACMLTVCGHRDAHDAAPAAGACALEALSRTISMPTMSPDPRTSPMHSCSCTPAAPAYCQVKVDCIILLAILPMPTAEKQRADSSLLLGTHA